MLKAGVFVDVENVSRCGGFHMRYDALCRFVASQGSTLVRANAYLAKDEERERNDSEYQQKREQHRTNLQRHGFRVVPKAVKWFHPDGGGPAQSKANSDLDLAVDAMLQARNLDYVVLLSGDGDFARLVTALQGFGCRVDVIGFHHVARELREVADHFYSGFVVPELLPLAEGRFRGHLYAMNEERYFARLRTTTGLRPEDVVDEIFCHGSDVDDGKLSNGQFAQLAGTAVIEFSIADTEKGSKAVNARWVRPAS